MKKGVQFCAPFLLHLIVTKNYFTRSSIVCVDPVSSVHCIKYIPDSNLSVEIDISLLPQSMLRTNAPVVEIIVTVSIRESLLIVTILLAGFGYILKIDPVFSSSEANPAPRTQRV